jgi:NAD(P)-dependent dehydrogenase (short-subunit alcohol dehydrogenase family)
MKILVIGATGTIGRAVVEELAQRHEVIAAAKSKAELLVDITDERSIRALLDSIGKLDALVATTGNVHFGPLARMTADEFKIGLHDKLLGQVQLALLGQHYLNDRGSITLTSGILSHDPIVNGASASAVNGAIESFVKAAALELQRGIRINVVSPSVLTESLTTYGEFFRGFESVPAVRVARAFSKSIEGGQTGQVYRVL